MRIAINPNRESWKALQERPAADFSEMLPKVKPIIEAIQQEGDAALMRFTSEFDKVSIESPIVDLAEIEAAQDLLSEELKTAIRKAAGNIEAFHRTQQEQVKVVEVMPGVTCWRKSVAIESVGLYIPGGTAPLFSTVLMLAIPARLAGCREVVLCSPPDKNGNIHPAILFAAQLAGVTRIFRAGGVQAIASMAYGTESIPKVFKIFGPGNAWVTAAKQYVSQQGVAIDMPAGPSEVLVWADHTADPDFVAADLLAQAEHGTDSQVVLVTNHAELIPKVDAAIELQLADLPRAGIAREALSNSLAVFFESNDVALDFINTYAPEHLILLCDDASVFAERIVNAGSVFIGHFSPESAGDYASGTNHTLPTNGFATAYSGVSLDSFVKKITFQQLTPNGLERLGPTVETMALAETLDAHARAVSIRLQKLKNNALLS